MSLIGEYICAVCNAKFYEEHLDGVFVPSTNLCQVCTAEDVHRRTNTLRIEMKNDVTE